MNRGSKHGLEPGHVLEVLQASRKVKDPVTGRTEHAMGSCQPGQAGRSSHTQQTLVQWISLFRRHAALFLASQPLSGLHGQGKSKKH